ncbi:Glycosyltransferase involved in cell wall bisynthesis [Xylanibacter ruminicola]|uniref:Glycosyltransferase involved in cell wall bisynthesis n=1 Tax=Xylanibacter ruminicola TaxID=839 RepID=A0A1H4DLD0_XYLRU|nr:glycosyltransferase [Xylanibacter ruminicola]SEA73022.1 Glycosyltransferase involved in cell wall bisynthesis [Xylanibacter ruminicola]
MSKENMVSIIVGIFNVSRFLREKSLSCIFGQTYNDWELILVDDGSTDDSGQLCDELASSDERIKVVHKENGGLGSARNVGLDAAQGDYVWFYDVDDEAKPNLLEYSVQQMESHELDMLQFSFRAITPSLGVQEDVHLNERMIEGQKQLRDAFLDDILFVRNGNGFAWNKFYRRSFLEKNRLCFENQQIQQDEVFNLKCYHYIERLYLSPVILYDYYIYNTGNNRSRFISNRFDIYVSIREHFETLRKDWSINNSRFENYLQLRFYGCVDQSLRFNMLHPDCPWNRRKKKGEMERVLNHKYTIEAIEWARENVEGFENNIYLNAYRKRSIGLLSFASTFFSGLRKVKHSVLR